MKARAPSTPRTSAAQRPAKTGEWVVVAIPSIGAAFEEVVALLRTHRQQAELSETRIRIDHDRPRHIQRFAQRSPTAEPLGQAPVPAIGDFQVLDSRGGEQFPVLARSGEDQPRTGEALPRRVQQNAGDGHVRPEGHAREHENDPGISRRDARDAGAGVMREQAGSAHAGNGIFDRLGQNARRGFRQGAFETVAQSLHHYAKQGGAVVVDQFSQLAGIPRPALEAAIEQLESECVTGSTCQRSNPVFRSRTAAPRRGR